MSIAVDEARQPAGTIVLERGVGRTPAVEDPHPARQGAGVFDHGSVAFRVHAGGQQVFVGVPSVAPNICGSGVIPRRLAEQVARAVIRACHGQPRVAGVIGDDIVGLVGYIAGAIVGIPRAGAPHHCFVIGRGTLDRHQLEFGIIEGKP